MSARKLSVILLFSFFTLQSIAAISPEWVRYPAISPDGQVIAFTYKGDIYRVAVTGGEATRLTFHPAHDYKPVWSPDNNQIAFASARHGNFDVFVMDAKGGEALRLTYDSSDEVPYDFKPANGNDSKQVVFKGQRMDTSSHRQYPNSLYHELYSVPVAGGKIGQVFTHTAEAVDYAKNGNRFLYHDVKGYENAWRKHHRSAVTRDIWLYDTRANTHTPLTSFDGEDRNPVFSQDEKSMYFLSERNGVSNVHKMDLDDPTKITQITDFSMHPVRFLSHAMGRLAFSYHGNLYIMEEGKQPQQLAITIRTQGATNRHTFADVNGEIDEFVVSPSGKEIAFIANGDLFVSSTDGAYTKQITDTPETEAHVGFSPDGKQLVYASERNLKWSVFMATKVRESEPFFYAASLIKETPFINNGADNYLPAFSPDGKRIAFIEDRRTLKVMDADGTNSKTLVARDHMIHFGDGDQYFKWSPDSQYLLFTHDRLLNNADVAIVKADGSQPFRSISQSAYYDFNGNWVMNGDAIMSFSNRHGLRSYATSGRSQVDVYATFLDEKAWDRFRLSKDEFALLEAIEETNKKAEETSDSEAKEDKDDQSENTPDPINIEWEKIDDRVARLTIHSSFVADAVLDKAGEKLYYLTRFEKKLGLWETQLRTKETKKVMALKIDNGSLQWDAQHENLYLLGDGKIAKLNIKDKKSKAIKIKAEVKKASPDLFASSFDHVWLRTQKAFYDPNFHGADWQQLYKEYQPKVAHIDNGHEFAELISELLGELNVSHAGARERNSFTVKNPDDTARLGIFYDYDFTGYGIKITEVVAGGPLDKANVNIQAGDVITQIDGVDIDATFDWATLLNRKVKKFVLLTVLKASGESNAVTVTPISSRDEQRLLYQRFVDRNEQEVLIASNNQLGYVHIPSMSDGPYRTVFDAMLGKHYDKQAIVVDTRFNGGGDLVADLATFFTGERFISYETADKLVGGEPTSRYTKPIVGLFNESMYSDGHCYASGFDDLALGTSIGMPVPGTCSFAGWESLPVGVRWGMVPVSAKNKQGEWMENNQMTPDILIKNQPETIISGKDEQLEKAIDVLLEQIN